MEINYPGLLQGIFTTISLVAVLAASTETDDDPKFYLGVILAGSCLAGAGFFIMKMGPFGPESFEEIWKFQPKDFYQGTLLFSMGAGAILGSIVSWLASPFRSARDSQTFSIFETKCPSCKDTFFHPDVDAEESKMKSFKLYLSMHYKKYNIFCPTCGVELVESRTTKVARKVSSMLPIVSGIFAAVYIFYNPRLTKQDFFFLIVTLIIVIIALEFMRFIFRKYEIKENSRVT